MQRSKRVLIQRDRSSTFDPFFLRRKLLGNKSLSLRPHYVHPSTWQSFLPDLRPTSDPCPGFLPRFCSRPKNWYRGCRWKNILFNVALLPLPPLFSLSLCIVISFVIKCKLNSSIFFFNTVSISHLFDYYIDLLINFLFFLAAGMFTVVNGRPTFQYSLQEWRIVATHYGGLAGLTFVGLLLAAILPCVGLFFCCCRCAGHCGARSQPFDKKHDHCRKVLLSMVLIAVATIIL